MVKLGAVAIQRAEEVRAGRLVQQVGVKPTQAELMRRRVAREERERIELERQKSLADITKKQKEYEQAKKEYEAKVARQQRVINQINRDLKSGRYSEGAPSWMNKAEQNIYYEAMGRAASGGVYAEKYELYPKGRVVYKIGGEFVSTYKTAEIKATRLEPKMFAIQEPKPYVEPEKVLVPITEPPDITDPSKIIEIIKKAELEREIRIRQGKPPYTEKELQMLQLAKNIRTRLGEKEVYFIPPEYKELTFKERAKESGWITTTHRKLVEISPAIFKAVEKMPFGIKSPEMFLPKKVKAIKAKAVVGIGPYFIPLVRESLLIGKGIEGYVYPGGRRELKVMKEWAIEKGFPTTKKFLATQTKRIILPFKTTLFVKPTIPPAEIVYALPAAEIALGVWGLKTRLTKPIIKIRPAKEPIIRYKETVKPYKEGRVSFAKFKITQYEPVRKAEVTTLFRKTLGKKPKVIAITKPTIRIIETAEPIKLTAKGEILGKGRLRAWRVGVKGKPVNRFLAELRGGERPLEITSYKALTKTQKYAFKKLAEMKVGRPVPEKFIPQILGKRFGEDLYGKGYLEVKRTWKVKGDIFRKGVEFERIPYGRRITRAELITRTREVKEVPFKTTFGIVTKKLPKEMKGEWFLGEVAIKPVTKPFPRATGKIPYLKGYTYIKDPLKDTEFTKMFVTTKGIIKPITRPVISKTLQKLGEVKGVAITALPKTVPTMEFPTQVTKAITEAKVISKVIPITAAITIPMYKIGIKEITKPILKPITKPTTKPTTKIVTKPTTKVITKPSIKTITKPALKVITKPVLKPITKPIVKPTTKPIISPLRFPPMKPKVPPPPPIFLFPKLQLPKIPRRIVRRKGIKRIFRKPSLVALGQKIYAPRPARFEPSGLVMRPIISKRKIKKRRKSPLFRRTLDIDFFKKKKRRKKK